MEQLFIFTAGNAGARTHLDDSIKNPISPEKILGFFDPADQEHLKSLANQHGLFAWGALPGARTIPTWQLMKPGDWVFCVYDNKYHYAAQIICTFDNKDAAYAIWGPSLEGDTWQYMYFLSKPQIVDANVPDLGSYLNEGYRGFCKISDAKIEKIIANFGSIENFISTKMSGVVDSADPMEALTREDVLQGINEFENGAGAQYGESTQYDLIHEAKRYPPKAIYGLSAKRILGRFLRPDEFKGGVESKCFRILRNLGFVIEPKSQADSFYLIRSNEGSSYNDVLGGKYRFSSTVPNYLKLKNGGYVVVDQKTNDGVRLVGYGVLDQAIQVESSPDSPAVMYEAKFASWKPFDPVKPIQEFILNKIKALPGYNAQHAIRVITKEIHEELTSPHSKQLCLIGTWDDAESYINHLSSFIETNGGWASWWSFVLQEDAITQFSNPFHLYLNTGGKVFPVRLVIDEFKNSRGNDGIESPWPSMTELDLLGKTRLGDKQNEIFKTWFKVTKIERIDPPLGIQNFEPAAPWSHSENLVNQNAFGYAYLKEKSMTSAAPPFNMDDALSLLFMDKGSLENILSGLRRKRNIVLEGPPGVGKTFAAKLIAYLLMESQDDSRVGMVQFHQSYAYEDFMQGWRPKETGGFELKNGVFYEFCDKARQNPNQPFVFVIDEINRGNLSKVFGELMMLIEVDKRGDKYAMPLTYSRSPSEKFSVPENVYLIGLMNTADRSLAMVDYALRRRFAFFPLVPQLESASFQNFLTKHGASPELIQKIHLRIGVVNQEIKKDPHLGDGFQIGHSYFCQFGDSAPDEAWFQSVIRDDIAPLIKEYWFDQKEKAAQLIEELKS